MTGLDAVIHAPLRLQLTAMLTAVDEMDFARAREELEVSDSVLSKHVKALADAGYVRARKPVVGGRRITRLGLTRQGRAAYAQHVAALRALIDGDPTPGPQGAGKIEAPQPTG